jgi:hypothetical protein
MDFASRAHVEATKKCRQIDPGRPVLRIDHARRAYNSLD